MPLRIIIDGYNLMGIYHKDLERERKRLIEKLKGYRNKRGHEIILVFDGYRSDSLKRDMVEYAGIKVIYTKAGETTDEFISSFLRNASAQWIVVSSDHLIQKEAWRNNSVPINSEDFERALERALKEKGQRSEENMGHLSSLHQKKMDNLLIEKLYIDNSRPSSYLTENQKRKKGNPRELSKKEKDIARILEKL